MSSWKQVLLTETKWQLRVRKSETFSTSTSYLSPAVFVNPGPPNNIIPRKCQEFGSKFVRKMSGKCQENAQENARKMPGKCQENARKMPGKCQENARNSGC